MNELEKLIEILAESNERESELYEELRDELILIAKQIDKKQKRERAQWN